MRLSHFSRAAIQTLLIAHTCSLCHAQTLEDSLDSTLNNVDISDSALELQITDSKPEDTSPFGIKDIEDMMEGMLSKKKISGAIVGTTISAALSAHPVGAFLGGLVGALVGKESQYYKAQQVASSQIPKDLFASLNKIEQELAQSSPVTAAPEPIKLPFKSPITTTLAATVKLETMKPNNNCYEQGANQPRSRTSLRSCFYHMY